MDGGALPFSVAALCGAKEYNPCLRNVLILYLGTVETQRQAAQDKDLPKMHTVYKTGNRWTDEADFRLRERQSS